MANRAAARINKELKVIEDNKNDDGSQFNLSMKGDDITEMKGQIAGPADSPYEGAIFNLDIKIPSNYPFDPPKVVFATKIWHPNINPETGEICLDILKNQWAAVMTLRTVFLSIQALLYASEPNDALNGFAAKQFHRSEELFKRTARHWAFVFAGGPNREEELEEKIKEVKAFGFEDWNALFALSNQNWEVERATASLALNDQELE